MCTSFLSRRLDLSDDMAVSPEQCLVGCVWCTLATWRLGVLKYCLAAGFIISYRMWAVSIVTYGLLTAYGLMLITNGSIAGTGNDYTLRLLLIIWLTCTCPSVLNL